MSKSPFALRFVTKVEKPAVDPAAARPADEVGGMTLLSDDELDSASGGVAQALSKTPGMLTINTKGSDYAGGDGGFDISF